MHRRASTSTARVAGHQGDGIRFPDLGGPDENDKELEKFQVIVVGYVDVAAQGGDPIVTFGEGFGRCVESHALRSMKAHLFLNILSSRTFRP